MTDEQIDMRLIQDEIEVAGDEINLINLADTISQL